MGTALLFLSSRTQFEAWLAMQTAFEGGLRPSSDDTCRFTIETILNGNSITVHLLRQLWEHKTPEEALKILAQSDVTVTNQSDKDKQLPKLQKLNERVLNVMKDVVANIA